MFGLCQLAIAETYTVAYQKGTFEILRNNKKVDPPVQSGDVIKVHKGSLVVLKSPQEVLKIMHDTVIRPQETKDGSVIDLIKGSIVSKVTKKSFQVRSRYTTMGVRGTQFFVSASGEDLWMCVEEGVVNVQKKNESVDVPAGKGVFIGKTVSKPEAYAWTKGINWKMEASDGNLDHKINLNYDVLENFYD